MYLLIENENFRNMQTIDLNNVEPENVSPNHLAIIPENINTLGITESKINIMSAFTSLGFVNLTQLDLSHNQIGTIQGLETVPNLRILDLAFNKITSMGGLENNLELVDINLEFNLIPGIYGIKNLHKLRYLNLVNNPISISAMEVEYPNVIFPDILQVHFPSGSFDYSIDLDGDRFIRSDPGEIVADFEQGGRIIYSHFRGNEDEDEEEDEEEDEDEDEDEDEEEDEEDWQMDTRTPTEIALGIAPERRRQRFDADGDEDEYDDHDIALARRHEDERERQIAHQMEIEARRGFGQADIGDDDEGEYEPPPVYSLKDPALPEYNISWGLPSYWDAVSRYSGMVVYADEDDEDDEEWFKWLEDQERY
jgi:hypothetical protein